MTEKLTRDMIEAARVIAERTGGFWTDQLKNTDQLAAYHTMAEEIWTQTDGRIDGFVQSVGTAASLRGTAEGLRRRRDRIRIVAVEPAESPVLSGGRPGAHKIDGIGAGFVVPLWQQEHRRSDRAGLHGRRDGHGHAPGPRGRPVRGDVHRRQRHRRAAPGRTAGTRRTVVTVMCDTGMKYLRTYAAALGPS